MTALPNPAEEVDSLIRANRAATPKAAIEARKVPRATISELNDLDIDEIRDRYKSNGYDDRTPITRVLDLIDLPRNVVANLLFRPAGVETKGLRRGALGLPSVSTSDALKQLGVSNKIVRGVVGFAGDVLLDPLTYLGPAGWGLEVMDNAGRAVRVGATGARGLKRGVKEVSRGTAVSDTATRELFDTLLKNAPQEVLAGDNAAKAAYLSAKSMGKIGAGSKAGAVPYYVSRGLGGDAKARGGVIATELANEGEVGDAVRQFVSKAGSAAGRGIGQGGSQVAHIPFTDISAKVPGFTRAGRAAEEDLAIARSAAPRPLDELLTPTLRGASELARASSEIENEIRSHASTTAAVTKDLERKIEKATIDRDPNLPLYETQLADHMNRSKEKTLELQGRSRVAAQQLQEVVEQNTAIPANITNPRELFSLRKLQDEIKTAYDLAEKRAASNVDVDLVNRLNIDADQHADDVMETWDRIAEQQVAMKKGGTLRKEEVAAGAMPPSQTDSVLEDAFPPEEVAPMSLFEKRKKMRELRTKIKNTPKASPIYEDLKYELNLLKMRDGLHDVVAGRISGSGRDVAPPQYLPSDPTGSLLVPQDDAVRQSVAERARPILDQIDATEQELARIRSVSKAPERDSLFAGQAIGQANVDAATLEREAEFQRTLDRLTGLRAQLEEVTAPARMSPGVKADDFRESLRQKHFDSLDSMERSLGELSDQDIELASEIADATHRTMAAYQRHFAAVRGAVEEARKLSNTEEMMSRLMQRFLGTDDQVMGRAALAGIDASTRIPGTERAAQVWRSTFGVKGSELADEVRKLRHAFSPGWRRDVQRYVATVTKTVQDAFAAVGVKPTGEDMEKAAQLLYAYTIRRQAAAGMGEAGREILYTTRMDGTPSAMMEMLQNAAKAGWFDQTVYGDFAQRLDAIAAQYGSELLEQMKNIEVEGGVLKSVRPGYFPKVTTASAREAMTRARRYGGSKAGGAAQQSAREAFQKEVSTDQVRFVSQRPGMEGKQRRLFGFELDQAQRVLENPGELAALRAEGLNDAADKLEELAADYREYMSLADRPRFRATDPWELNEIRSEGAFDMLLDGVEPVGGFMETNMLAAMGNRIGQHARALARESWSKYVKQTAITIPGFRGFVDKDGKTIRSSSGAEATVSKGIDAFGREVPVAIVGGQKYRPITVRYKDANDNPVIEMLGKENAEKLYHEQVAAMIERAADVFEPDNAHWFLRGIDTITKHWKSITLLHPSWTVFNAIGDTANAIIGGANIKHLANPEFNKFSANAIRHMDRPEKLKDAFVTIRGQRVSAQQIIDDALAEGVLDGTMMQETAFKLIENQHMMLSSMARGAGVAERFKPSTISADFKEMAQRYAIGKGRISPNAADKAMAGRTVFSDRYMNNVIGPWVRINSKFSNYMRLNVFLSFLEDGFDVQSAARKAVRSQMDYSDLTRVERDVFRRVLPFYSWMRNNGAYQLRTFFEHPVYAASFPKLKESLEEAINGDQKVPANMRPNWMRNALALQIGGDPDERSAIILGSGVPIADLYQYMTPIMGAEGVMDFLHYIGSGINPVINVPLQLASGQETFSGRSIGADAYSGDLSATEFVTNQVRPIAEARKLGRVASEGDLGKVAGRLVIGGRLQDFSQARIDSQRKRDFEDKEKKIRAAITRSERIGRKEDSLRARVKLLELYNWANENGLADDVPVWAKKQLAEMN